MNCQDIALILDDADIAQLDGTTRRAAMEHLETCAGCSRDWKAQARLAGRNLPPAAPELVAGCRATFVAVPAAQAGSRRFVRGGTLALVALAAAAMMFWAGQRTEPLPAAEGSAASAAGHQPGEPVQGDAEMGSAGTPARAVSSARSRYFVQVLPLPDSRDVASKIDESASAEWREHHISASRDPGRTALLESFRTSLIDELRAVPDLVLVDSPAQVIAADAAATFFQIGFDKFFSSGTPDGQTEYMASNEAGVWVEVSKVRQGGAVMEGGGVIRGRPLSYGAQVSSDCDPAATSYCAQPQPAARAAVEYLRELAFPPDPSATRQMQAVLEDSSLQPARRFDALQELVHPRAGAPRDVLRDPATLRGALDLAATADAALRARIWRRLRGTAHPDLLQPLLDSALKDEDEVRLQAVATLGEDFAQHPRVRNALESVARDDARPLVRALARRALSGPRTWDAYMVSTLQDSDRPAAERIEAIVYHFNAAHDPANLSLRSKYDFGVLDAEQIDTVARLLPAASAGMRERESQIADMFGGLAVRNQNSPALTDALLHYLQHGTRPRTRKIAGETLAQSRNSDPRVRPALQKAIASDPDPGVRDWIRQVSGQGAAPTTMP